MVTSLDAKLMGNLLKDLLCFWTVYQGRQTIGTNTDNGAKYIYQLGQICLSNDKTGQSRQLEGQRPLPSSSQKH